MRLRHSQRLSNLSTRVSSALAFCLSLALSLALSLFWSARVTAYGARAALTPPLRQAREATYAALDQRIFPAILAYTTHRAHISLMLLLWLALLLGGSWTAFELVGGNYTNGLSGLMTCIIALQQARHTRETRAAHAATHARLDAHAAQLDALHAHLTRRRRGGSPS